MWGHRGVRGTEPDGRDDADPCGCRDCDDAEPDPCQRQAPTVPGGHADLRNDLPAPPRHVVERTPGIDPVDVSTAFGHTILRILSRQESNTLSYWESQGAAS